MPLLGCDISLHGAVKMKTWVTAGKSPVGGWRGGSRMEGNLDRPLMYTDKIEDVKTTSA